MEKCRICGITKDLTVSNTTIINGKKYTYYLCRKHNTEKLKAFRATKNGKKSIYKTILKYNKKHPERLSAWHKAGKIELKPCMVCDNPKSHRHHPNINNPLSIIFLCALHHKQAELKGGII